MLNKPTFTKIVIYHCRRIAHSLREFIRNRPLIALLLLAVIVIVVVKSCHRAAPAPKRLPDVFPKEAWLNESPESVGMSSAKIEEFANAVGGSGIVTRHGYSVFRWGKPYHSTPLFSAAKPLISALLMRAIKEKRIKSVDDLVSDLEPGLKEINGGKDTAITWRHLANMTSGYGLAEKPGKAFSYNDDAITLYLYTLPRNVFFMDGTNTFHERLARPLGFENALSVQDDFLKAPRGIISVSAQDMARFGLMILRNGRWGEKQILPEESVQLMLHSPVPASLPLTSGSATQILENMPSVGAGRNQSKIGPGMYSFNWWLNTPDNNGHRLMPGAPEDTVVACGLWGKVALVIVPSLDLVVVWQHSMIGDFQAYAQSERTQFSRAIELLCQAVTNPKL